MTVHKSNILNIISPSTNLQHFITLPTKVRLVKAMFYPVVMYGCEIWTIKKKAEHRRIDVFELWCWEKTLESPLDCKEIKFLVIRCVNSGDLMYREVMILVNNIAL